MRLCFQTRKFFFFSYGSTARFLISFFHTFLKKTGHFKPFIYLLLLLYDFIYEAKMPIFNFHKLQIRWQDEWRNALWNQRKDCNQFIYYLLVFIFYFLQYALIPREFLWTDGSSVQCGLCRQNNASVTLPHAPGAIRHFKRRHRKTYNSFSKEVRYQDYRAQGEAGQDPNFEYNRYPVQNQHMMAQGPGVYPMLAAAAPQVGLLVLQYLI